MSNAPEVYSDVANVEEPAGFRLLFQHALREPEFKARIEKFRADITAAAVSSDVDCSLPPVYSQGESNG